jgi:hypothetical protein
LTNGISDETRQYIKGAETDPIAALHKFYLSAQQATREDLDNMEPISHETKQKFQCYINDTFSIYQDTSINTFEWECADE